MIARIWRGVVRLDGDPLSAVLAGQAGGVVQPVRS
jgi:hypothetical protein